MNNLSGESNPNKDFNIFQRCRVISHRQERIDTPTPTNRRVPNDQLPATTNAQSKTSNTIKTGLARSRNMLFVDVC